MSDLLTVALVCAATLPAADCTRATAIDVAVAPSRSPHECALGGQAGMAGGALVGEGTYLKIACERRRVAQAMGAAD